MEPPSKLNWNEEWAKMGKRIKATFLNMGEDIAHIHPNVNKTDKALDNFRVYYGARAIYDRYSKKSRYYYWGEFCL